jgi:hypothetical protein
MKGTRKQYEKVEQLPPGAIRVRTYADNRGITVAYVYKLYNQGKLHIVDYEGINFVTTSVNSH